MEHRTKLCYSKIDSYFTPSQADIEITQQLVKAGKLLGIDLIDHLVVTKTSYISIPNQYS